MPRKTRDEIQAIKEQYEVTNLWSWSKYKTYKDDPWEFYLKYICHIEEDRTDNIYSVSGNSIHDLLERYYTNKIAYHQLNDGYEDSLRNMKRNNLKYDRSDEEKNKKIAKKYEGCMRHFFTYFQPIMYKHMTEKFLLVKVGDYVFQCYIDFLHEESNQNNQKEIIVTDWKTSTLYQGDKRELESGQLILYAEAVRQKLQIPMERIKVRWGFLKYVTIRSLQANGEWKEKIIERDSIGDKLSAKIKMWLNKSGYSEDEVQNFISQTVKTNSLSGLPPEIQSKFQIADCYITIPFTSNSRDRLFDEIITTLVEAEEKTRLYHETKDENIFWKDVTDKDSFRLAILSGYSRKLHKPYDLYLQNKEMFLYKPDEDDLSWIEDL